MGHVVIGEKYIGYTARDEIVRVEAYGKDRIRVRSTRNGSFSEESWTLLPPLSDECTVTGNGERGVLTNGCLSAEVVKMWGIYHIIFYKNGMEILRTKREGDITSQYRHVEGNNYRIKAIFEARYGERLYGLGQEQQDYFKIGRAHV